MQDSQNPRIIIVSMLRQIRPTGRPIAVYQEPASFRVDDGDSWETHSDVLDDSATTEDSTFTLPVAREHAKLEAVANAQQLRDANARDSA